MNLVFYMAVALTVFLVFALLLAPADPAALARRQTNAGDGAEQSSG